MLARFRHLRSWILRCSLQPREERRAEKERDHSPRRAEDREPDAEADAERRPVVRSDVPEDETQIVPVHQRGGCGCTQAVTAVQLVVPEGRRRGRDRGHRGKEQKEASDKRHRLPSSVFFSFRRRPNGGVDRFVDSREENGRLGSPPLKLDSSRSLASDNFLDLLVSD